MGWFLGRFWDVVLISAMVALVGGAALMQAAMSTGGNALGQGLSGAVTFVKEIGAGFKAADAATTPPAAPPVEAPAAPPADGGAAGGAEGGAAQGDS